MARQLLPTHVPGRRVMVLIAIAIFAFGFTVHEVAPDGGFTLLYGVSVALIAAAGGLRAGFAAATAALVIYAIGDVTAPKHSHGVAVYTGTGAYVSAAVRFYLLAGILGWYSDRVRLRENEFRGLVSGAPDATVIVDEKGRVVLANRRTETLLGYTQRELIGMTLEALVSERFRAGHAGHRAGFFAEPRARPMGTGLDLYVLCKDGGEIPVEISLSDLKTERGLLAAAAIRDITARKRAEDARREAEERFRRAFDEAPIGMAMLDLDRRFVQVNEALCEITGYSRAELEATSLDAITDPADLATDGDEVDPTGGANGSRSETHLVHAGGRLVWVTMQTTLLRDEGDRPLTFLAQIQDVTERRRYEERLRYIADHDALTGLLNRGRLERELETHCGRIERYGGRGALIVLDLDHFKLINDTLGHGAGDAALIRAADALRARLRESDVLSRFGGDEFAVLLPQADAAQARLVADELLAALRAETLDLGGHARPLAASAGIAMLEPGAGLVSEDVLVNADLAMYDAKNAGGDRTELYAPAEQPSMRMSRPITWAQRIGGALENDLFTLLAQPIVNLSTGRVTQRELLLRMQDERGELVPPGTFLYIAERLGLMPDIDRWVTQRAIAILADGRARGEELTLEVNLSGVSIGDGELLALVERELARTGVAPSSLVFEVTETAAVVNMSRAGAFARALAGLGCRFALDDFGAGYGSFYYLKHLPFDFLKIDGEFVKGCRTDHTDRLLIQAAVDIAAGLGKQTIAEFVSDAETVELLTGLGVDYGQGLYLGAPEPIGVTVGSGASGARQPGAVS